MTKNLSHKTRSVLVGLFILIAYGVLASSFTQSPVIVMTADVFSGLAVIGIAVLMYPLFKVYKYSSLTYLCLKYVEGILMIIGGVLFLSASLQYTRDIIYTDIHVYAFIISAFVFYYLLYVTRLVPRFISVWGVIGIFALLLSSLFKLINVVFPVLDYFLVLIITNEIFLAVWLMVKGLDKNELE